MNVYTLGCIKHCCYMSGIGFFSCNRPFPYSSLPCSPSSQPLTSTPDGSQDPLDLVLGAHVGAWFQMQSGRAAGLEPKSPAWQCNYPMTEPQVHTELRLIIIALDMPLYRVQPYRPEPKHTNSWNPIAPVYKKVKVQYPGPWSHREKEC